MGYQSEQPKRVIQTGRPSLKLIELTLADADDYYRLVDRNRDHLTRHGDYSELKEATRDWVVEHLANPTQRNARFGIWLDDILVGRADLSLRSPGHFVIGYWIGSDYTGNGYVTIACEALIRYGESELGATDIYAGVTKGNIASEALLGRLGFERVEDRGTYTLFHLVLPAVDERFFRGKMP